MLNADVKVSKASIDALSSIARFRHQKRTGQAWLVGDRRLSTSVVTRLKALNLVEEIALRGTPILTLTDQAKSVLNR
jgi:hypothetical protein